MPVSWIWNAAARAKAAAYRARLLRTRRLPGKVISVGNLTTGGTGKTPMVIWIATRLRDEGKRVGILTRGYMPAEFQRFTARGTGAFEPVSDEVAILRERLGHHVSIGVGANRYETGLVLARHGIEWFVLDDGFQQLRLGRDVNLLLIDALDPFGGGQLLPAGKLREPKSALERADAILITRSESVPELETVIRSHTQAPIFYATTAFDELVPLQTPAHKQREPRGGLLPAPRGVRVFAFCGVGNPAGFFSDLARWGFEVTGRVEFADHHVYSQQDWAEIESAAFRAGAGALLCTEKDAFNLRGVSSGETPVFAVRISLSVTRADELWKFVMLRAGAGSEVCAA